MLPGKGDGTKDFIGAILKPKFCRLGEKVLGTVTGVIDDVKARLDGVSSTNICVGKLGDCDERSLSTVFGFLALDWDGGCCGAEMPGVVNRGI